VGLNGFFVAAEFAIVKVRRTRLEELAGQGIKKARLSLLCVDQLDEYLSATQLGITIVSLGLGWIGEPAFFGLLRYFFPQVHSQATLHFVATAIAFFVITLLHVVLGELVPKSMAIQRAEKITLVVSRPLRWFYMIARPLILAFSLLANAVLRLLGYSGEEEAPLSENELKLVMKESHEDGVISESEAQIINRAFEFADKRAADIMVPTEKVDFISLTQPMQRNLVMAKEKLRTRYPVCREGLDTVIGIVHMKDIWPIVRPDSSNRVFEMGMRPALFVDSSMRQDQILKLFQSKRAHMAVVRQGEKPIGIVTMEDVLEELVGDIRDEHGN